MTYALARAPTVDASASVFSARDEFAQVVSGGSDPLDGLVMAAGGNWDTSPSAGTYDVTDFVVEDTGHTAQRSEVADVSWQGRYAFAPPSLTSSFVQIDFRRGTATGSAGIRQGVLARFTDANNWLAATAVAVNPYAPADYDLTIHKRIGGGTPQLMRVVPSTPLIAAWNTWYTLALEVTLAGVISLWVYPQGGAAGSPVATTTLPAGELPSGKGGFYDESTGAGTSTRNYKNFALSPAPTVVAALHASRSMRFTHEGIYRDSADGTQEGRVPVPEGKYPTVIPATRAGRKSRLVVKGRRFDQKSGLPDLGIADALTGDMTVTPRIDCLTGTDVTPGGFPLYLVSNTTTDLGYNANNVTMDEMGDTLATAILGYTAAALGAFSFTNVTTRRTLDCNDATEDQIADFIATLITDLAAPGAAPAYTITNNTTLRALNGNSFSLNSLPDVAATFALDLINVGDL